LIQITTTPYNIGGSLVEAVEATGTASVRGTNVLCMKTTHGTGGCY